MHQRFQPGNSKSVWQRFWGQYLSVFSTSASAKTAIFSQHTCNYSQQTANFSIFGAEHIISRSAKLWNIYVFIISSNNGTSFIAKSKYEVEIVIRPIMPIRVDRGGSLGRAR